jgi:hypothetical protein
MRYGRLEEPVTRNFYERFGIGATKYSVHTHDGVSTHQDGSPFYGMALFRNRRKKDQYVRELKRQGYVERGTGD